MRRYTQRHRGERGVTALFLVMFAATLLTVITVGFMQIMVSEQSNSLDNILSQAAYDSAVDGVEDGKRAIAACQQGVAAACNAINAQACTTISAAGLAGATPVVIQSSTTAGADVNQSYTCVKILPASTYLASITNGSSILVPLRDAAGSGAIKSVKIDWQLPNDLGGVNFGSNFGSVCPAAVATDAVLCNLSDWTSASSNIPALMEAQFITPGSLTLANLDTTGQTFYLRPVKAGITTLSVSSAPPRYTPTSAGNGSTNQVWPITCATQGIARYACTTTITGFNIAAQSQIDYLRLGAIYRGADVRVTLYNSTGAVAPFDTSVQMQIDSTGRANDVYRRVVSRIGFGDIPQVPQNALDIGGSLCKDYGITPTGVTAGASGCTP